MKPGQEGIDYFELRPGRTVGLISVSGERGLDRKCCQY
jgi:hypothetical protein